MSKGKAHPKSSDQKIGKSSSGNSITRSSQTGKFVGKDSKYLSADGHPYLDKRTVVRSAQSAGRDAAIRAMDSMGFSIVAENGWIVRKYKDGLIERIEKISSIK